MTDHIFGEGQTAHKRGTHDGNWSSDSYLVHLLPPPPKYTPTSPTLRSRSPSPSLGGKFKARARRSSFWFSFLEPLSSSNKHSEYNKKGHPTHPNVTPWKSARARRRATAALLLLTLILIVTYRTLNLPSAAKEAIPTETAVIQEVAVEAEPEPTSEAPAKRGAIPPKIMEVVPLNVTSKLANGEKLAAVLSKRANGRPKAPHSVEAGMLYVDMSQPSSSHPILQLMASAQESWDAKLSKQSKTLKAATEEYKKRYGMNPPKGFDKWWAFMKKHSVQMPDEYDQILRDVKRFFGVHPGDMVSRIRRAASTPNSFAIVIENGTLKLYDDMATVEGALDRAQAQVDLLNIEGVVEHIPDVTATYNIHDSPVNFIGYDHQQDLRDFAASGTYLDPTFELPTNVKGWKMACPPSSAARGGPGPKGCKDKANCKSFIADSPGLYDLCSHPKAMELHGLLNRREPQQDLELKVTWSHSKSFLHSDVLAVPTVQFRDIPVRYVPWEKKKHAKLLWRGSNTGTSFSTQTRWRDTQRPRLLAMTAPGKTGNVNILPTTGSAPLQSSVAVEEAKAANARLFDIGFAGKPIQCNAGDGTCAAIEKEYLYTNRIGADIEGDYKYIMDVDGNAWSARLRRYYTTGNVILKSTVLPEWWSDRVQPWVHFIPVKLDFTDLHDIVAFLQAEDDIAAAVAEAGQRWAETYWRREDMTAYTFRLYLEWARLQVTDRSSMDFVYHPSMEVE